MGLVIFVVTYCWAMRRVIRGSDRRDSLARLGNLVEHLDGPHRATHAMRRRLKAGRNGF